MIKEVNPSEDYLKAITGKFDLETVFTLDLSKKSISKLNAIPKCTSIIFLNLSKNKLSSISGLSILKTLEFLDLSFNNISSIDGLENLIDIKHLKLHGNNIKGPLDSKFKKWKKIEKLTFKIMEFENDDTNTSNPICKIDNYRNSIFELLPSLKMLDCIPKGMETFDFQEEKSENVLEEKLNPNNFNFDFSDKIHLNEDDIINDNDIEAIKKNIEEKYAEFEKGIEELKNSLKEIK
jgi:hypothetical protein